MYNGSKIYEGKKNAVSFHNILLGNIRVRQLRSTHSPQSSSIFTKLSSIMVNYLEVKLDDRISFSPNNEYEWNTTITYSGLQKPWKVYPFTSGGFSIFLKNSNGTQSEQQLQELFYHQWIDSKTAFIIIYTYENICT